MLCFILLVVTQLSIKPRRIHNFFVCIAICRDHAGGNDKIKQLLPGIKVYGGSLDNVRGCTHQLQNGDTLSVGSHLNILALHTPWYLLFAIWLCHSLLFKTLKCMLLFTCVSLFLLLPAVRVSLSMSHFLKTLSFSDPHFLSSATPRVT